MSAPRRSLLVLAPGQVWRGTDDVAREVLAVYPAIGAMPPSVRVRSANRRYGGSRVITIGQHAMRVWIDRQRADLVVGLPLPAEGVCEEGELK